MQLRPSISEPFRIAVLQNRADEQNTLCLKLREQSDVSAIETASTLGGAERILEEGVPDAIFTDVRLNGDDVIEWLCESTVTGNTCGLVFVTDGEKEAVRAFEIGALDYLKRPVHARRLEITLHRLKMHHVIVRATEDATLKHATKRLCIKSGSASILICPDDIVAITSVGGNYTCLSLGEKETHVVRRTFKEWEKILDGDTFMRIHRNTIINLKDLERFERTQQGEHRVYLTSYPESLSVSRRLAPKMKQFLTPHSSQ